MILAATLGICSAALAPLRANCQDQSDVKGSPAEPDDAEEVRQQIATVQKLQAKLPDRGAALYFLAVAKEHLRDSVAALALLKECVALQEGFDPSGEPTFGEFRGTKEFTAMIDKVHRDFPVLAQAREAFRTVARDLVPEGLAYDARRKVFYMSSLNRRKILQFALDGVASDFVPAEKYELLPVLGIRLSSTDDTVWADSFSDGGRTELLHFDPSGKLLGRFKPADSAKHGFNDLVVRRNGEVLTTDSLRNEVLRFDPLRQTFSPVTVHRPLFYPNGIALASDGHTLYLADRLGVIRVDLSSGDSRDLEAGPRSTLAGIDGLYCYNGGLIGIQNGIGSPRVAAFRLSNDGFRVTHTTVLENRSNFTVLPTTGAIRGRDFYFISNSQIDNMSNDRVTDVTKLEVIRIGVVRLP